jgi:hypothetical protein
MTGVVKSQEENSTVVISFRARELVRRAPQVRRARRALKEVLVKMGGMVRKGYQGPSGQVVALVETAKMAPWGSPGYRAREAIRARKAILGILAQWVPPVTPDQQDPPVR